MTHLHIMHNIVRPTLNDQIEAYGYLFSFQKRCQTIIIKV